jgi:hypothetical protein
LAFLAILKENCARPLRGPFDCQKLSWQRNKKTNGANKETILLKLVFLISLILLFTAGSPKRSKAVMPASQGAGRLARVLTPPSQHLAPCEPDRDFKDLMLAVR